jgi:ArsR family transcriptional regulator
MGNMTDLVFFFKALADPTRLRILRMLLIKPLCVCEVMHVLNMAQSTTSKHLQILLKADIVEALPGGTWTIYRIVKDPKHPLLVSIVNALRNTINTKESEKDAALARKVDRNRICLQKMKRRHLKRGVS